MPASLGALVISSPDPIAHAAFYRELLAWTTVDEAPDWVRLRDPQRERPGLSFQLQPADRPPTWPTEPGGVQLQAHLDVLVDDLATDVTRALELGATVTEQQFADEVRVMRDPFGHVFCLFEPGG